MPALNFFGNLGAIGQGALNAEDQLQQLRLRQIYAALGAQQLQQRQQQQQAIPGAFQTLQSPAFQNMFGQPGGFPSGMPSSQLGQIQQAPLPPLPPPSPPSGDGFNPAAAPFPTAQNLVRDPSSTPLPMRSAYDPDSPVGTFRDVGGSLVPSPPAADPIRAKQELTQAIPPEFHPEATGGASNTFRTLGGSPLQYVNRFDDPGHLAQVISQANPGASDETKMAIFEKLFPMLSQSGKAQFAQAWDMYKFGATQEERKSEFKQREADRAAQLEQTRILAGARLAQGEEAGGQVYQPRDAQGQPIGQPMWITKGHASPIAGMPEGAAAVTKAGTQMPGGGSSTSEIEFLARYVMNTGSMPVGFSRNKETLNAVYAKVAELGGDPGKVAEAAGTFKANQSSLASATKMRDAALSYEKTALKNLDVATEQLHRAAPTDWGPAINKWIETGQTFVGDTTVPPSVAAVVTVANEYAKVMSGATGAQASTVDARREALQVLNPYFSSGQWDAVAQIVRRDMANREQSLTDQVDLIKGRLSAGGGMPTGEAESKATPQTGLPDFKTMSNDQIFNYLDKLPK